MHASSPESVIDYLGGARLLGLSRKHDFSDVIQQGLPYRVLKYFSARVPIDSHDLVRVLGTTKRSLYRHQESGRLPPDVSDRLSRVARIMVLAGYVLEDPAEAQSWLVDKTEALGNKRPIDLVVNDAGAERVRDLLMRMEYGVY